MFKILGFLFAGIIIAFNFLGFDDKSILLFLTSPPFWIMESSWFVENVVHPSKVPTSTIYALTMVFWLLFGAIIDFFIKKMKEKQKNKGNK